MASVVILGTQWGDEGKGKLVDVIAGKADMVVRFQGGNNAGHTIILGQDKYVFHLLPSGVLYEQAKCVIASGVVVDLGVLLKEISIMESKGRTTNHIYISDKAHLIMPYHIMLDKLKEQQSNKIGTTQRGIGPCYADKINRVGIRVADLMDEEVFIEKLKTNIAEKNIILSKVYGEQPLEMDSILKQFKEYASLIKNRVIDSAKEVREYLKNDKFVIFEGAQASMLDIDFGTYPFVTSSSPSVGGVLSGAGVPHNYINKVVGIVKAYSTRVGEGPFVTEQINEIGESIRNTGAEFGSTTGRPRRCGYLDLVVVKHSCEHNGLTDLVITKLDVLSCVDELKICTAYEVDGKVIDYVPATIKQLQNAKPIYKTFPGFKGVDISGVKNFADLPKPAQDYVKFIEEYLNCKISVISVGPERTQNIIINNIV
jgi:adenylosuccinate synthase